MKNFIKILCVALCALMLLGALASCKGGEKTDGGDSQSSDSSDGSLDSDGGDLGESGGDNGEDSDSDSDSDGDGDSVTFVTEEISVMSFNIRYLTSKDTGNKHWDSRKAAVCDFVLNSGAGIIGMQEVKATQYFDLKDGISEKYEILWYASYADANPQGNAVVYDRSVWQPVGEPTHFWLSPTPDIQSPGWQTNHFRSCVNVLFEHIESGARLNVFVTHLDHKSQTDMVNGVKLILERMGESEYPAYLCGDFNCQPDSAAYNATAEVMQDAQATALDSDEGSTFTSWGGYTDADKYVIDFCFFSKDNVKVKTYDICDDRWGENNENYLSDHNPVAVTAEITSKKQEYPDISGLEGVEDWNNAEDN